MPDIATRTTTPPEGGFPAGYPKVFFSVYEKHPPEVVFNEEDEAAIDKKYWMTIPPETPAP